VTISPRLKRRDGLITVVPLSTTPPSPVCDHHCRLTMVPALPEPFDSPEMWVKADMLATVGFARLDLIRTGRDPFGKRKYLHQDWNRLSSKSFTIACYTPWG
jgi:mRNA interferase MazF